MQFSYTFLSDEVKRSFCDIRILYLNTLHIIINIPNDKQLTHTYIHIILPVVFYGCENWSLTLREERRLKMYENRVLRRIYEPKGTR
jgi:hypothetical protein